MNGRRLFREYAQHKGKEAVSFVTIDSFPYERYESDNLVTKDSKGNIESTSINYKDMVHWIIRNK